MDRRTNDNKRKRNSKNNIKRTGYPSILCRTWCHCCSNSIYYLGVIKMKKITTIIPQKRPHGDATYGMTYLEFGEKKNHRVYNKPLLEFKWYLQEHEGLVLGVVGVVVGFLAVVSFIYFNGGI